MEYSMFVIAYYTSPKALAIIRKVAEFETVMIQLSGVTGLSVSTCADIVRNTVKETDHSWEEVAAHLKYEAMKKRKTHG